MKTSSHNLHPQAQANLKESFVPGEIPDAIRLQEKLRDQTCVLASHLYVWELDKAYMVLRQIVTGMEELKDMHQRKVGFDKGFNAGYREVITQSKTIETLVGELAKAGRTVVIVQGNEGVSRG